MKTLKEVKKEIAELLKRREERDCETKERNKINSRVELLNQVALFSKNNHNQLKIKLTTII